MVQLNPQSQIMTKTDNDVTLGQAFEELEKISSQLERGDIDLEKSIPQLRRSFELAKFIKKRLAEIENEIEEVKSEFKDVIQNDSPNDNSEEDE